MNRTLAQFSKAIMTIACVFGLAQMTLAQFSVTTNGGSGLAPTYTSLADAITALNGATITSAVVITCAAGAETAPATGYSITAQGTAANTIIIEGAGAGSSIITAGVGTTTTRDAIFKLIGADYVTIQGFTMQESIGNLTTTTQCEWGVALLHASTTNGAQNNTIQNNAITLNKSNLNTFGIYGNNNHSATNVSSTESVINNTTGPANGNKIYNNTISNVNFGICLVGTSTAANQDIGNDIGGSSLATGNTITNWGGGATGSYVSHPGTTSYCILVNHQIGENVSYNTITSAALTGTAPSNLRAILKDYTTTGASLAGTTNITNNTVTVTNNFTTSGVFECIRAQGSVNNTSTLNINTNTILNSSVGGASSANSIVCIINSEAVGTLNMNGNIIRGTTSTATSGGFTGISNTGAVVTAINMNNNQVGNASGNAITYSVASGNVSVLGITNTGGASTCALAMTGNDFQGFVHTVQGGSAHTYITQTGTVLTANISSNTWTNINANISNAVTFINHNYTIPSGGSNTISNNSIVTGYTKGGTVSGNSITITTTNGSSTNTTTQIYSNNNFSNITAAGLNVITGFNNTDGLSGGTSVKTITGNTFNNWITGAGAIVAMNVSYFHTGTHSISNNTISNLTGQGAVTGLQINNGANSATSLTIGSNTINGLASSGGAITGITCSNTSTGLNISGNTIHSCTATGSLSIFGIVINGASTTNVFRNKMYNLEANGLVAGVTGIRVLAGTTVNLHNNLIGDLRTPATFGSGNAISGIDIASGSGAVNLYYNTVYLSGTSSQTNWGTSALTSTTGPTVTLNNNILINNTTPTGVVLAVAYRRGGTTLTTYGGTSNNNLFYCGTPGAQRLIFYDGTNSDQTLAAFKTRVGPTRDAASVTENPPFLSTVGSSANFLHIDPTIATQVESGGAPIAGITTDFDGDTRSVTTPDIGADEFAGIALDLTAPAISYTALANTCLNGDRTLTATIIDASGVPTSGALQPRIYYRKNAGAWFSSQGSLASGTGTSGTWNFTIIAADMGGVAGLDAIQYYVIAQDVATPNIGSNPSTGLVATNVNTVTTAPTSPNSYTITVLNGTYTVGSGGNFTTLTAAVAAYNASCLGGPVVFELTATTYNAGSGESFPITIGYNADASTTNTLTIRPAASVSPTITGSNLSAILILNGADWITIDGSNAPVANGLCQTNSTRNLTIQNTNTGTSSAVVWLQSNLSPNLGAANNTVRNCIITGNGSTTTLMGLGSGSNSINTTSTATDSDNNTFENNSVSNCQIGIYSAGASAGNKNEGTAIRYNAMSTHGTAGIVARFENGISIIGNSVTGVLRAGSPDVAGISAGFDVSGFSTTSAGSGEVTNATVTHNMIGSIVNTGGSGFSSVGIAFGAAASGTTLIANNTVSGVAGIATSPDIIVGLLVGGGAGTLNVYHNTVRMQGVNASGSMVSAAFASTAAAAHPLNLRNNILVNTQSGGTHRYSAIGLRFAPPLTGMVSNNNNLLSAGPGPGTYVLASTGDLTGGTTYTFATWQALQDAASTNITPAFLSPTDLHLSPTGAANGVLVDQGANLGVTTDIDCDARAASPTIGADEFRAIYYSQVSGNANASSWDVVPVGVAGPAIAGTGSSFVVQNGHTITNTANLNLRNLTVDAGGTLDIDPSTTIAAYGSTVALNGSVVADDLSKIELLGSTATTLTLGANTSLWDLTVNTSAGTTLTGNINVRGTLQLDNGNFDCTGDQVWLRSTATETGRLGPVAATAIYTGNLFIERYIPAGATNWRLLGSPIAGRAVGGWQDDFVTAGYPGSTWPNFDQPVGSNILWPSIRWYDETDPGAGQNDGMIGVSSNLQSLASGQGFAAWCGDNLVTTNAFVIDLGNGAPVIASSPIALPMTYTNTGNGAVDGWNLVSNPVPSPIAFDQIARGADVEDYITYYNPANGNTAVWDISLNSGTNGATNTIQSMQGFFLKAVGPAVTTTVEEADKVSGNGGGMFGTNNNVVDQLRLRITSSINSFSDETVVIFSEGVPDLDASDALKYVFGDPLAPQIACVVPEQVQLAIDAYGSVDEGVTIPVSVNAGVSGEYTITLTEVGELGLTCITLEDTELGTFTVMSSGSAYSFTMEADDDPSIARFVLHATAPIAFNSFDALCGASPDGQASVNLPIPADVTWTDGSGTVILAQSNVVGESVITGLGAGSYEVHVSTTSACGELVQAFTISAPFVLEAQGSVTNATCADSEDGSVDLLPLGGVFPYAFLWSDASGSTTEDLIAAPGSYTVTITDANNCTWTSAAFVIDDQGPDATLNASSTSVLVNNTVQFNGTDADASYFWDFGDGATSTDISTEHAWSLPGDYTVTMTVDNGNCIVSSTVVITVELNTGISAGTKPEAAAWLSGDQIIVQHAFSGPAVVQIDLVDATGRVVMQRTTSASTARVLLPAADLPTGVWFVRMAQGERSLTLRVPVVH